MESRLQSNEVRIPKTSVSPPTHVPVSLSCVNSPSAFLKSRNENGGHNVPEFDFSSPCQYFKSSFARSLSINSGSQTKSLDFGINFGLPRTSPIKEEPCAPIGFTANISNGVPDMPPPLPRSQPPPLSTAGHNPGYTNGTNCRSVWSSSAKQSLNRRSLDSSEIEVLRLRKECQNLIEENRRLMGLASGMVSGNLVVPGNSPNIEAVILQTQVDTLQWQLKQVEASRQMYRAVMEEVVRFLERCHHNLDSIQKEQIARSKSIHHVYRSETTNENNPASPRARSSTNLSDVQKNCSTKGMEESATSSPATSYNNFRDFTWRRSPKRTASSQLATAECDPEKLAQEAFRLLRTAQNLLNTQEPDLTAPKHTIELQYGTNFVNPSLSSQAKVNFASHAQNQKPQIQLDSEQLCLTFSRKMNMRESRLSLRSSTDGSVHSTSSSKNETDEENHSPPLKETAASCATEDESGFSSISSFQEIGLPLNSTMISPIPTVNSSTSDDSGESNTDVCLESRNSTLKASQQNLVSEIGLPSNHNHRRWDSAPAIPPRTNLHRFSTLPPDESPTVLWV